MPNANETAPAAQKSAPAAMTSAERFRRCMHFEPVDHVVDMEFGYWAEVFQQWPEQGLPKLPATNPALELYFGLEQVAYLPVAVGLLPHFKPRTIKNDGTYVYYRDGDGVYCRRPVSGESTMPEHLDYPLKSQKDYANKFRPRFIRK
ncbi:MAG: hypothetical protein M1457_01435, partial [bacterium]|nr:hypothetical protein [bacterium]